MIFIFTKTEDKHILTYIGSLQDFYWKKYTHESIDVVRSHYNVEKQMRQYMYNMLIWDTQSDVMKKEIDHWFDSFEKFHPQDIIISM